MPDDDINAFVPGPRVHIEGRPGGTLSGLTFAAKDLFDVAGHPTGGGNPDWARSNPVPARHAPQRERQGHGVAHPEVRAQGGVGVLAEEPHQLMPDP